MAIVPDESPTSAPDADFGANDWLLEEMYEQYTADPSSVDETWAEYFKSHGAPSAGDGDGAAAKKQRATARDLHAARPQRAVGEPIPTTAAPAPAPAQASPRHAAAACACHVPSHSDSREARAIRRDPAERPGARGGVPADPPEP